jgi:regulator of CtrA degradation
MSAKEADASGLTPKVLDSLYGEAMALADEARAYFDSVGQLDRRGLEPMARVVFSCESLKVTTRLMHVISWLLVRKAVAAGEMTEDEAMVPDRRLGRATPTPADDTSRLAGLPSRSKDIIARSQDLYFRVKRLEDQLTAEAEPSESPALAMIKRLQSSF